LKGDMEAQNQVLSQVSASHQDDSASQLKLGDWDAEKGTYSSIEVLPAGSDPGTGISIHTYPGDEVKPDPSKKPDGGTQNDPDKQNNQN
jgi:hypothetical protein